MSQNQEIKALRGTKDILPEEAKIFAFIEKNARYLFIAHGYGEIRTPIIEESGLFLRSIGEETDIVSKEMYLFKDKGDRDIALRPEGTAGVVRAFIEHKLYINKMSKLFYGGPMFRYERPQGGRQRQFHQIGAEVFGVKSGFLDAEVIHTCMQILEKCELTDLTIYINSVGCPNCRPNYNKALVDFLNKHSPEICEDCNARKDKNPLRALDCKKESCQAIYANAPKISQFLCDECLAHQMEVTTGLSSLDLAYIEDEKLVRGLDYYTKTVFEVKSNKSEYVNNTVAAGGRYDNLVGDFCGIDTPAVGFALGMERLVLMMKDSLALRKTHKIAIIPLGDKETEVMLPIAHKLRHIAPVHMIYAGNNIKAKFKEADNAGASISVICGDRELANGVVMIKDMINGTQESVANGDIIDYIQAKLIELDAKK